LGSHTRLRYRFYTCPFDRGVATTARFIIVGTLILVRKADFVGVTHPQGSGGRLAT
jgi:hypothetical protein